MVPYLLYPRNNTKRVKCRGIFNVCTAQQTSLYWIVLLYPWPIFIHIRLADFIRTTTWIYTPLNSRHIITTTGNVYLHNIRAATVLVFTEINSDCDCSLDVLHVGSGINVLRFL
jgi:hypothetical protein